MSGADFTLTQGDTGPSLTNTFTDLPDGTTLAGATVTLSMTSTGSATLAAGTQIIDDAPCVIVDAANNIVRYDWRAGIDTAWPGWFRAQFKAELEDGTIVTSPNDSYVAIYVQLPVDGPTPTGPVPGQATDDQLRVWATDPDGHVFGTLTRDAHDAVIGASWLWDDGTIGVFTGTPSVAWPGTIDSYTVTYNSKTLTQPTMTRNSNGDVIARPEIVVS